MRELIDRAALIAEYDRVHVGPPGGARKLMEDAPIIEERKKGKWIYGEDEYGIDGYQCDKCGFFVPWYYVHKSIDFIKDYHWCPSCGADMRGERDEPLQILRSDENQSTL